MDEPAELEERHDVPRELARVCYLSLEEWRERVHLYPLPVEVPLRSHILNAGACYRNGSALSQER